MPNVIIAIQRATSVIHPVECRSMLEIFPKTLAAFARAAEVELPECHTISKPPYNIRHIPHLMLQLLHPAFFRASASAVERYAKVVVPSYALKR